MPDKSIEVVYYDDHVLVTCHEYWNMDTLQAAIRDEFTRHCLSEGIANLIIDMTEPQDIKYSKGFFSPLKYMLDRTHGIKNCIVIVAHDEDGSQHMNEIAARMNEVTTADTSIVVTFDMDEAAEIIRR